MIEREGSWFGLYTGDTSKDAVLFTPESTSHPAKMSIPLLRRILAQMTEWGWLQMGGTVVDPFGGRGTTAAVWCSLHPANRAVTIEVEAHFVKMQRDNREHARRKLGRPLLWKVLRGDARRVDGLLAGYQAASRCSPPYGEMEVASGSMSQLQKRRGSCSATVLRDEKLVGYGAAPSQIGGLPDSAITSAPYAMNDGTRGRKKSSREWDVERGYGRMAEGTEFRGDADYGSSPGQIGNLPDVGLMSPPYGAAENRRAAGNVQDGSVSDCITRAYDATNHGVSVAQIGNCKDVAGITSPPYENALDGGEGPNARFDFKTHSAANARTNTAAPDYRPPVAAMSPPYEGSLNSDDPDKRGGLFRDPKRRNDRTLTANYSGVTSPPYPAGVQDKSGIDPTKFRTQGGRYGPHSQAVASGYRAVTSESNGGATSQIGAMTTPDCYFDNLSVIDAARVVQLDGCQADTKSEPARSAGSPATADDAGLAIAPIQTGLSTPRNETERSPKSPGGNRGRKSPGHGTEIGTAATTVGEVTDGSVSTTSPRSETGTFARTAEQPEKPPSSPPTTSSLGKTGGQRPSKISSPSATPAICGGTLLSPDGTTALSAEQNTSPRAVPPAPVQSLAKPGLTPPSITAGSQSAGQPENYAEACLKVYAGLARAGVRYIAVVTKNPTRAGKLRRLDLLTSDLLQRAGYRIVATRRAWLWMTQQEADERAGQATLFDDLAPSGRNVGRLSFFKRLQIAKGGVAAQWEDVIFAELDAPAEGQEELSLL